MYKPMRSWIFFLLFVLSLSWSCRKSLPQTSSGTPGTLIIHTELDDRVDLLSKTSTSSLQATDLTLEIFKEGVSIEKLSPIGSASQEISLDPGVYNVQAYSAAFTAPAFEMPVYADEEQVTIQSESTTTIEMICTQSNAGIQIVYDEAFQQAHTDYSVSISQQGYTLEYKGLDATRTGYFLPGEVSLLLTVDGEQYQQTLDLQAQRIYILTIQDEAAPFYTMKTSEHKPLLRVLIFRPTMVGRTHRFPIPVPSRSSCPIPPPQIILMHPADVACHSPCPGTSRFPISTLSARPRWF